MSCKHKYEHVAGWSESLVIPFITHQMYSKEKPPHTTIYRSCQCPLVWKQYVHTEVLTCSHKQENRTYSRYTKQKDLEGITRERDGRVEEVKGR